MGKNIINPWTWQVQFGFVQTNEIIWATRRLFRSRQVPVDSKRGPIRTGDMTAQAYKAFDNLT